MSAILGMVSSLLSTGAAARCVVLERPRGCDRPGTRRRHAPALHMSAEL
jgi:hypothetical protein